MTDYATRLRDHLTLNVPCIDRIFLEGYAPQSQTVGYVWRFSAGNAISLSLLPPPSARFRD